MQLFAKTPVFLWMLILLLAQPAFSESHGASGYTLRTSSDDSRCMLMYQSTKDPVLLVFSQSKNLGFQIIIFGDDFSASAENPASLTLSFNDEIILNAKVQATGPLIPLQVSHELMERILTFSAQEQTLNINLGAPLGIDAGFNLIDGDKIQTSLAQCFDALGS